MMKMYDVYMMNEIMKCMMFFYDDNRLCFSMMKMYDFFKNFRASDHV